MNTEAAERKKIVWGEEVWGWNAHPGTTYCMKFMRLTVRYPITNTQYKLVSRSYW